MNAALITLAVVAVLLVGYSFWLSRKGDDEIVIAPGDCTSCDGQNSKCEQECMMEAATKPIEYFDDEELDAFAGRSANSYSDDEAEQFRYVFETMRTDEVARWARSLNLRNIELPNQVKDEVMLFLQ